MHEFTSIEETFQWFMENTYPKLPTEQKIKLKDVKYAYSNGRSLSLKRKQRVLEEHGEF